MDYTYDNERSKTHGTRTNRRSMAVDEAISSRQERRMAQRSEARRVRNQAATTATLEPTLTDPAKTAEAAASKDLPSTRTLANKQTPKEQLDQWLRIAVKENVSDIHLVEGVPPIFRKHGNLQPLETADDLVSAEIEAMGEALCSPRQWQEFKEKGETDLAYDLADICRFRVNIFRQMDTVSIALRQIPIKIPELSSLGVPTVLRSLVHKSQGLFLVTGPTGSGKSTTLAAMLDYLNESKKTHILTLEDPIEYIHKHKKSIISQREVGRDTQSFGNGLRAALRQDPDVILVGELRDFETISIALTAAETGHLVLGTLHTSSAPATIERIVDVFPAEQQTQIRTQLAGALIGILSQRLLPTVSGNGRVAATEMLVNTPGIASLIRSGKTHQISNMLQMGKSEGMHTMQASLQRLVESGRVDADVADTLLAEGSE